MSKNGNSTDCKKEPPGVQTAQQQRARYAFDKVHAFIKEQNCQENSEAALKSFKSYAAGFPAMILMTGLGQAAAFYRSKSNNMNDSKSKAYNALYKLLSDWLTLPGQPYHEDKDLLTGICKNNMHTYQIAQIEALSLLVWVKKFANAFIAEKEKIGDDHGVAPL